jgi:hypothetical protein
MTKVKGGASLELQLFFTKYESIKPGFSGGWEEEVPDDWTDEQKRKRIGEIQKLCRQDIEKRIDDDIYDVKEVRLFDVIGEVGQRIYPENKKVLKVQK